MINYLFLIIILSWMCYQDCTKRLVNNYLIITLGLSGLIGLFGQQQLQVQWLDIFAFIGIGILLLAWFHWRLLGGGDIKLLFALMPWFSLSEYLILLILMTLLGGVLAVIAIAVLGLKVWLHVNSMAYFKVKIAQFTLPYTVPIAIAVIFLLSKELTV